MKSISFAAGDELRALDGTLLLTFARPYTAVRLGPVPSIDDVILPNGEHPKPHMHVDARVFETIERLMNAG